MLGINSVASAVKTAVKSAIEFVNEIRDDAEEVLWGLLSAYLGRSDVKSIEEWDNCYFVAFFNGSPTFVSKDSVLWVIVSIFNIIGTSGHDDPADPSVVFIPAIRRIGGYILMDSKYSGVFVPDSLIDTIDLSSYWVCGRREVALERARDLSLSESLQSVLGLYSVTAIPVELV